VAIGFTTLVPYASAVTIVLVSVLLALDNPRTALEVLAAAISVGQVVDQVIQPRLMGSIVGLQPAWLLVCLPIGARVGEPDGLRGSARVAAGGTGGQLPQDLPRCLGPAAGAGPGGWAQAC